ncbi:MAG: SRPBCC domain-containing protein [Phycicoccus sp.]|nr:SRPBCC domain-containing protein [Phycicoccus sp.]NMM34307.1 SRPBCC domain-containing protein [Phycicoccus sp.]
MTDNNGGQSMVIERTLEAPTDLVWKMWTEPEHFAAWYGPGGATIPVATMDVRVGGTRLLCLEMTTPNGTMQMWFTGEYLEVVENQRLVYTDSMSDEHGNVMSPEQMGMPAGHPTTTEVSVELEDINGGTNMVLTHTGVPAGSPGAAGWAMALDKLAARLDEAQRA